MANLLNVWGQYMGGGWDLDPGQSHYYILWGAPAQDKVIAWVAVHPLPQSYDAGEKILEIMHFQTESTDDGGRRIFFTVTNVGAVNVTFYTIACGWTDAVK